jgi:hypothetical protein
VIDLAEIEIDFSTYSDLTGGYLWAYLANQVRKIGFDFDKLITALVSWFHSFFASSYTAKQGIHVHFFTLPALKIFAANSTEYQSLLTKRPITYQR